jgi:hypothetical protein
VAKGEPCCREWLRPIAWVELIIEGYLKTRDVLFCALAYEGPKIPDLSTFTSLIRGKTPECFFGVSSLGLQDVSYWPWLCENAVLLL